mmetsp:Transcript_5526/g.24352  ORF Transcript_5526/g.24352 Transcript_5526/m.24352 type:complete len:213 (+) Transcript_5526:1830-2468(+)
MAAPPRALDGAAVPDREEPPDDEAALADARRRRRRPHRRPASRQRSRRARFTRGGLRRQVRPVLRGAARAGGERQNSTGDEHFGSLVASSVHVHGAVRAATLGELRGAVGDRLRRVRRGGRGWRRPARVRGNRPPRRAIRWARYDPAGTGLARPHARAERRRSSRGGALAEPSQTIHRGTRRRVRGRCERRRGDGREAGGTDSRRGVLRGCG